MGRRPRGVVVVVSLLLAALAIGGASVAGATQVGVNVTTTNGFQSPQVLAALRASRPKWVRVFVGWNVIEPQPGVYDAWQLHLYRRFFDSLPKGTLIDADVEGTPSWASGSSSPTAPPTDDTTFAQFLTRLIGAWHRRVNAWEIWNEESSPGWWTGSVAQYADLVKAAYPAIKAADPAATVILGANSPDWLSQLYSDGIKNYFNADAIHTDTACNITSPFVYEYNRGTTTINRYFFLGFTGTHALMAANGDAAKPIYMTEIGWSSTSAECATGLWAGKKLGGVTQAVQAKYLTQAYSCLAQKRYSYIRAAMWFEMYNGGGSSAPLDNYGLLNTDYSPKPAYDAFKSVSLHGARVSSACGNFSPPRIRILRPTPGSHFHGPLHIAVAATSRSHGVREITIDLTGRVREHFGPRRGFPRTLRASLTWLGARHLRLGPHRIKIVVTDRLGNVATRYLRVVRSAAHRAHRRRRSHRRHR